jgi:transposase
VLVELGVVEQRYAAVREVLEGASVVDVARRNGVARHTVHEWLRKYATGGMAALVERSSKPARCAHQMAPAVEARVVELRPAHPGWGPRTILHRLASESVDPLPGRSSVHRALVRHGLIEPGKRRRKRDDYKRWERSRSMELWQMDVVGRIHLADGTEVSAITPASTTTPGSVCAPAWWLGPPPGRCAAPWPGPCVPTGCPGAGWVGRAVQDRTAAPVARGPHTGRSGSAWPLDATPSQPSRRSASCRRQLVTQLWATVEGLGLAACH